MTQAKTRGDQLNIQELSLEISNNPAAITSIAAGLVDDVGAVGVLNQDFILNAIEQQVIGNDVVNVFIYDTSTDRDGGAWVDQANWQSWFGETFSSIRGSTKMFPKVALLTLENDKLDIYDASDSSCPLWMRFNIAAGWTSGILHLNGSNIDGALYMKNGILYVGDTGSSTGLDEINFITDSAWQYTDSDSWGGDSGVNILSRDATTFYHQGDTTNLPVIADNSIRDVVVTSNEYGNVLYVATDNGLSRIDADRVVSNWTDLSSGVAPIGNVAIFNNHVAWNTGAFSNSTSVLLQPVSSTLVDSDEFDPSYMHFDGRTDGSWTSSRVAYGFESNTMWQNDSTFNAIASLYAVTKLYPDYTNWGNSMIAHITPDFCSGILHGDIRGAFLANSEIADRSYNNISLVETGDVIESPVVSGSELLCYGPFTITDYIEQPYNSGLDFGLDDFYIMFDLYGTSVATVEYVFDRYGGGVGSQIAVYVDSVGRISLTTFDGTSSSTSTSSLTQTIDGWNAICIIRHSNGSCSFHVNGQHENISGTAIDITASDSPTLKVGVKHDLTEPTSGRLALLRMGAGVPTVKQINTIYEQEKSLFELNAKCTLQGTSSEVSAIDYNESTGVITACAGDTITRFNDLIVVDSNLETATSISTKYDKELTGV